LNPKIILINPVIVYSSYVEKFRSNEYQALTLRQVELRLNAKMTEKIDPNVPEFNFFSWIYDLRSDLKSKKYFINPRILHQVYVRKIRQFAVLLVTLHAT
jgi:hypothetical protein